MYFVAMKRFVAIYVRLTFWKTWGKKVLFWDNNSVSWARSALLHGIYCILYWIEFANLQLRAKRRICRENSKCASLRLTKTFVGIFAHTEGLPTSATLLWVIWNSTQLKISTSLRFPPTIEARAPVNRVGRATRMVQDDAPGRRVSTESSGSEVSIPPTTT